MTIHLFENTNFQDQGFITSENVRFLCKEPIVGLKIFNGDSLKKRLQMTFVSEGHYNLFCNKLSQWLGMPINSKYPIELQVSDSQTGFNQAICSSQSQSSQVQFSQFQSSQLQFSQPFRSGSQVVHVNSKDDSPISTQYQTSQMSAVGDKIGSHVKRESWDGRNEVIRVSQPKTNANYGESSVAPDDSVYTHNPRVKQEPIFGEPSFAHINCDFQVALSQAETLINTTYFDSSIQHGSHNLTVDTDVTEQNEKTRHTIVTQKEIDDVLTGNKSSRNLKSRKRKNKELDPLEDALVQTVSQVSRRGLDCVVDLSDEQLCLKIARKLSSKSFLLVLKRVEAVIAPEFDEYRANS